MKYLRNFFCLAISTLLLSIVLTHHHLYADAAIDTVIKTTTNADINTGPDTEPNVHPYVQPYIVGGEQALPGEFPWTVRFLSHDDYGALSCGGSLIHPEWVLTAGHCGGTIYTVTTGAHDLQANSDPKRISYNVDRVIVHHLYDDYTLDNDIALLHLSQPVVLNDRVQLIPLISPATDGHLLLDGLLSTVAGWGYVTENGPSVSILRKVDLPLINNTVCQEANIKEEVTENMMCAGYPQGGKDACSGDSGGALMVTDSTGQRKAVGIVSWGDGCARADAYGVYTRISQYLPWIDQYVDWESVSTLVAPTPTIFVNPGVPIPTATPIAPPAEGVGNRDFEQGSNDMWAEHSQQSYVLITSVSPVDPWSGDYLAWLGGTNDEISNLMQSIQLPEAVSIEMTYSYQTFSHDSCGRDNARVLVNNQILKTYNLCKKKATVGWVKESLDLTEFAGQRITLRFYTKTDPRRYSSLIVDDIELIYSTEMTDGPVRIVGILNGDFEQGGSGDWFESSTFFGDQLGAIIVRSYDVPSLPGSGEYLAWLGGLKDEVSRLEQMVILPSHSNLALTYRYAIESNEESCDRDIVQVLVNGTQLHEYGLCRQNETGGWREQTLDLSAYAGRTVPIEFWSSTDDANLSSFYLDEMRLIPPPDARADTSIEAEVRAEDDSPQNGSIFLPIIMR